ncbi:helix-turn-helix domain-containing protein [Eubacterium aggregans]|uniref:helix-turn-helix domain-containing protein n=1 Tax=Eubacterium aggregans TaxID=81409 RepID=UPI003F3DCA3E
MKNDTFGKRFRALRTQKGLTQEKIADIFYLNTSSISKYEKDKSMPEIALLIQIADFFWCLCGLLTLPHNMPITHPPRQRGLPYRW